MNKFPVGWAPITLKEIVNLRTGPFGSLLHKSDYIDGGIPLVNPMHIINGRICQDDRVSVSIKFAERLHDFRLHEGDVVLGRRGEMGRCAVVMRQHHGWLCGTGSLIVRPDTRVVDANFLQKLISSDAIVKYLTDASVGSTMANLNQAHLLSIDLALPPKKEQTRIVEKLEELLSDLDAGVSELKAAQKKLSQYRQSLLKAAVEGALTAQWRAQHTPTETGAQLLERILKERRARWEAKQLAKFKEQGKAPPKDWRKKYPEPVRPDTRELPALPEGWAWASLDQFLYQLRSGTAETSGRDATAFPVLKSSAVRQGHIDWEALNYLDSHQIREDNFLEEGDLLITRLSGSVEYVGCCAIAGKIPEEGMQYPDRIFCGKLALRDKEIAYYLMHCLFSPQARILIEAAAKSTAGHKRISLSDLFPFPIPLPPESELKVICNQIADSLDQIRETGKAVGKSLKQSAAQRKNILKAAFSGQLVPQDPGDEPAAVLLERIRAQKTGQGRKSRSQPPEAVA